MGSRERRNIYVHNGSLFDYIFLLRYITEMGKVKPLIKDGKFININLSWDIQDNNNNKGKYNYSINFRDSLLLLPAPLRKLAIAFNVENKGIFPFNFLKDSNIPLDYIGNTPDLKFYDGVTNDEYKEMFITNWDLRKEAIKYCELDCRVLYQVIDKFNSLIFNKFSLNVHKFPTLSSLAFGIFRIHYLKDHKIPQLGGKIYDFIKQSYTGGRVDVIRQILIYA